MSMSVNVNWVQEGEFGLLCAGASNWEELQVEVSGTEAQNLNVKEEGCDPKQSVRGTGISEVEKVEGTSGTGSFLRLEPALQVLNGSTGNQSLSGTEWMEGMPQGH